MKYFHTHFAECAREEGKKRRSNELRIDESCRHDDEQADKKTANIAECSILDISSSFSRQWDIRHTSYTQRSDIVCNNHIV